MSRASVDSDEVVRRGDDDMGFALVDDDDGATVVPGAKAIMQHSRRSRYIWVSFQSPFQLSNRELNF